MAYSCSQNITDRCTIMTNNKEMKGFMIKELRVTKELAKVYLDEAYNEILHGNLSGHYLEYQLEKLMKYKRDITMIDMALTHRDKLKYTYYKIFYED